jgi:hypothetical protein
MALITFSDHYCLTERHVTAVMHYFLSRRGGWTAQPVEQQQQNMKFFSCFFLETLRITVGQLAGTLATKASYFGNILLLLGISLQALCDDLRMQLGGLLVGVAHHGAIAAHRRAVTEVRLPATPRGSVRSVTERLMAIVCWCAGHRRMAAAAGKIH